jgi:hypothetical protein
VGKEEYSDRIRVKDDKHGTCTWLATNSGLAIVSKVMQEIVSTAMHLRRRRRRSRDALSSYIGRDRSSHGCIVSKGVAFCWGI